MKMNIVFPSSTPVASDFKHISSPKCNLVRAKLDSGATHHYLKDCHKDLLSNLQVLKMN